MAASLNVGDLVVRTQVDDPSRGWVGVIRSVSRPAFEGVYPNGESYSVLFLGPTRYAPRKDARGYYWFGAGVESPGMSINFLRVLTGRRREYWERKMVRMLLAGLVGRERS